MYLLVQEYFFITALTNNHLIQNNWSAIQLKLDEFLGGDGAKPTKAAVAKELKHFPYLKLYKNEVSKYIEEVITILSNYF